MKIAVIGCMSALIVVFTSLGIAGAGMAEQRRALGGSHEAEDHELPFLPAYCRYCAAINKDKYRSERSRWQKIFPPGIGLHHYCYGLIMLNRLQRGVGDRSTLLERAEAEFSYVLKHSTPQHNVLYPEVHLKMGITKELMGQQAEAIQHFFSAIRLKKDYVAPYIHIIEFYTEHQDYQNALKTAKLGLKYSPKSKLLKMKLSELRALCGGD